MFQPQSHEPWIIILRFVRGVMLSNQDFCFRPFAFVESKLFANLVRTNPQVTTAPSMARPQVFANHLVLTMPQPAACCNTRIPLLVWSTFADNFCGSANLPPDDPGNLF